MDDAKAVALLLNLDTWVAAAQDGDIVVFGKSLADLECPEGASASQPGILWIIIDGVQYSHQIRSFILPRSKLRTRSSLTRESRNQEGQASCVWRAAGHPGRVA